MPPNVSQLRELFEPNDIVPKKTRQSGGIEATLNESVTYRKCKARGTVQRESRSEKSVPELRMPRTYNFRPTRNSSTQHGDRSSNDNSRSGSECISAFPRCRLPVEAVCPTSKNFNVVSGSPMTSESRTPGASKYEIACESATKHSSCQVPEPDCKSVMNSASHKGRQEGGPFTGSPETSYKPVMPVLSGKCSHGTASERCTMRCRDLPKL